MKALRLTIDEKYAVAEALGYHYLSGEVDEVGAVSGYGVLVHELSEEELELREHLLSALDKVEDVLGQPIESS